MAALRLDVLDQRLTVEATLAGFPGRVSAQSGWDTGWVTLAEHMVYFIQRGSVRMETGDHRRLLPPGSCAVIPPGTPFRMRWGDRSQPTMLRCRILVARGQRPSGAWETVAVRARCWELEPVIIMLIAEADGALPHRQARMRALASLVFTSLDRDGDGAEGGLDAQQRARLEEFADSHRGHQLAPRDLADQAGLTLDYFTRRFRLTYGQAPRQWLKHKRIRAACVLLAEGGASLDAVASALGYADRKSFGRQFAQVMRMPPGRWRRSR